MKILVLGGDGRAHALVWKLFNSPLVSEVICAPGNGGTSQIAPSADLDHSNAAAVARWAFDEGLDIIMPAGSRPLQQGLVDEVVSFQIGVCGPSQRSTVIEHSRCQAKEFMLRHHLPTATGRAFTDRATAEKYLATIPLPVIIKADHPAAGEGIYRDRYAALAGLSDLFAAQPIEGSSNGIVIERFLEGPRVVLSAFTDGRSAIPMLATRLYDRTDSADSSPLARGIGSHTSNSRYAQLLTDYLHQKLIQPIVAALGQEGMPCWGILGIDCVVTSEGPRLTAMRYSLREGEAQVVLPRLEEDLMPWIQAMIAGRLHELPPPRWSPTASIGLGLTARGYPHHFATGGLIQGLETLDAGVLAFHSATENPAGLSYSPRTRSAAGFLGLMGAATSSSGLRVAGGHVLTIVSMGVTLAGARGRALVNAERITFEGRSFREDIGAKEFA